MDSSRVDYTNLFRGLGSVPQESPSVPTELRDQFLHREAFDDWTARYRERLRAEKSKDEERQSRMNQVNPKYILRNHLAQRAITQAVQQKDYSEIDRLLTLLSDPFTDRPGMEAYVLPPPPGEPSIIVSCSS
jgi:uncharacterized protein YdiU (UPF0061 family)